MHLYLHLRHGDEFIRDSEGADYHNLEHAREDAMWAAREIMSERILQGKHPAGSSFEVADDAGKVLLVFPFQDAITDRL